MQRRSLYCVAIASLSILAVGCPGAKTPPPTPAPVAHDEGPLTWKPGLGFRLSNADDDADHPRERPVTASTPLGAADVKKIVGRLPDLKSDPDDPQAFNQRAKSIPAPRPGQTVTEAFPPPVAAPNAPTVPNGPLKVERRAPEGPVALAPYLNITFTQPMVPLASVSDLAKEHPPVKLTPEPPGKWRWLGTRTVLFQPDHRFPMATDYTVEVPAGTKAQNGATLATAEKWSFSTPPPVLKVSSPNNGSQPLEPLVFIQMDQAIDPTAFMKLVSLEGPKGPIAVRIASADEVEANDQARRLVAAAEDPLDARHEKRWVAFRPETKLPVATGFTVKVKQGARGIEGPKPTEHDQAFSFETYGRMAVSYSSCGGCTPLSSFNLSFTNAIDMKTFDPKLVTVEPALAALKVTAVGSSISIQGKTKGRTKYKVTIGGALGDVHDQTMGADASVPFEIGSAQPMMFGAEQQLVVLDPAQTKKDYTVYTINEPGLHARVYAVKPEDWKAYAAFQTEWERPRKLKPPGKLVFDKVVAPKKAADELVATAIDLAPAFSKGLGQALVVVEPTHPLSRGEHPPELHVWVESTALGIDAMIEQDQVVAFTTRLADGAPLSGVDVQLLGASSAKSDAQGLARVPLTTTPGRLIVGRAGDDTVLVPPGYYVGDGDYRRQVPGPTSRWFVYDDRGMYKPGEEVRIKGFVRRDDNGRGGDVTGIANVAGTKVTYKVHDPRGTEIGTGETTLDEVGGFDLAIKLANNVNLGSASVEFKAALPTVGYTDASHAFEIQEFRRPEFEVTATKSEGPFEVGRHAVATLSAAYYAGGGLPDAPVDWTVTRSTTSFTPPNRSDYHFGPEPYAFWNWRSQSSTKTRGKSSSETWTAKTNPQGLHRLRVDFDALEPGYPMQLALRASVTDVNRQSWAGNTSMLVHPSKTYGGIKLAKSFLRAGENIDLDAVIVDLDGKVVPGRHIVVKAARIDWVQQGAEWVERELERQMCEADSPAAPTPQNEKLHCTFKTKEGGDWRITSIVTDEFGRKNESAASVWVLGGTDRPKDRALEGAKANLLLDKKEYVPGDTAELLVVAPFAPAEGILTVRRNGIVQLQRITMASTSQTFNIKLDEALVPNAEVHVQLVGQDDRTDDAGNPDPRLPRRPAFATGTAAAKILPVNRTLGVKATAKLLALEPGGTTQIDIDVRDAAGRGVDGAEVAVVVADESVLALSGYQTPDPIAAMYPARGSGVSDLGMRNAVLLGEPDLAKLGGNVSGAALGRVGVASAPMRRSTSADAPGGAPMQPSPAPTAKPVAAASEVAANKSFGALANDDARQEKKESAEPSASASVVGDTKKPIAVRSDFSALALFAPKVRTDGHGHASVPLKLPDNLTRYRVMAVAATKERSFGAGESTVTARLPVMVRPSAPRFLSFGDRFDLPVVIQNQTDAPIEVGIVARATNATFGEPTSKRVKIAANDRAEVRFAAATMKAGTARFQFGVATGGFSDASQIELPVYTPATTEAFATYGEIDEGAMAQPVTMPNDVFPQFGGLEIETSSTQVQALTDAVLYLQSYPFECNEQLASRVLSLAALRDVLSAFKARGLQSPAELTASVKVDMEKLKRRQHYSGGWGFWQEEPWPYLTIHVAHALARAKEKGYEVDAQMIARALVYLRSIESHIPSWYGPDARSALIAYSIYVRDRLKDADPGKAKRLIAEVNGVDELGIEAVGWIWPTISKDPGSATENAAIRRHVANRVVETAGAAHFVSDYKDGNWVLLNSDRRADGILLEAMIGDQKDATLIPKLVKGLLGHRKGGRWENTNENAFVLLALDRYFNTYEKVTPDFVARVWLGERFAGEHAFKGRTTEHSDIGIPMSFLAGPGGSGGAGKSQNLVIGKDGPGRLYYRVGMQYAPTDLRPPPSDQGFAVARLYEAAEGDGSDVKRDADGSWRIKAGAKVRVRVTMVNTSRRYHVALVDWLPAGLEPMNPALAVTGEIPKDPTASAALQRNYGYWSRTWYEHQNMRDERVEAFASLLWDGVWEYSYVARATTPGTFVVPPAKAEEMYAPETFGRSAGDRVIVAD